MKIVSIADIRRQQKRKQIEAMYVKFYGNARAR
jgi:hypothetical protein